MKKKFTPDERLAQIQAIADAGKTRTQFHLEHPYLYMWAKKHNVDLCQFFPRKPIHCHLTERAYDGVDVYKYGSKKLYKHYSFVIDALRDLDLTYYYFHRVISGKIPHINGFVFVKCDKKKD